MKIYYKTKILINGLFPMENYSIDGFVQKTGLYDESVINTETEDFIFYASGYLLIGAYSCKGKEGTFYEYFESNDFFELEIEEGKNVDEIQKYVLDNQTKKISTLQKKLRLITGYAISLPVFKTTIYKENKEFLTYTGYINHESGNLKVRDYTEDMKVTLTDRLKYYITDEALTNLETKNQGFKRALSFYTDSFNQLSNCTRFILLISALEALFNLNGKSVKHNVSKYTSKILFLSKDKENKAKRIIKRYYNLRSNYIHGSEVRITIEDVNILSTIVREVLLIYWNISLVYMKYKTTEIKNILETYSCDSIDVRLQLFIKYSRTKPEKYEELYNKVRANFLKQDYNVLSNKSLDIK